MPLSRFVLIVVLVVAAAGVSLVLAALLASAMQFPAMVVIAAIPALLVAYVVVRVIWDRLRSADDTHYDRIRK